MENFLILPLLNSFTAKKKICASLKPFSVLETPLNVKVTEVVYSTKFVVAKRNTIIDGMTDFSFSFAIPLFFKFLSYTSLRLMVAKR